VSFRILQARLIALRLWLTDLAYLGVTVMEELDELFAKLSAPRTVDVGRLRTSSSSVGILNTYNRNGLDDTTDRICPDLSIEST